MRVSVVIPVLNEAPNIAAAVDAAWLAGAQEVIVVDGGSTDGTPEIAAANKCPAVSSPRGRAAQQNAGARRARGDVLLFLHADTRLAAGGTAQIAEALQDAEGDQRLGRPGEAAERRTADEEHEREHVEPLRAEAVRRPAGDRDDGGERQRVPGDDPLDRLQLRVEVLGEVVDRDVDDGHVEDPEVERTACRSQHFLEGNERPVATILYARDDKAATLTAREDSGTDGRIDETRTWTRDATGALVAFERRRPGRVACKKRVPSEHEIHGYVYDRFGVHIRTDIDHDGDGTVDAHSVDLAVEDSRWNAVLAAQGGLAAGIWRGTVESAEIRERALGQWHSKSAAGVEVGREHAVLAPLCLAQTDTEICASFRLTGAVDDEIALSASNFDVRALQPFLPENLALSGIYELSAELTDLRGAQRGHVALTGGTTHVRLTKGAEDVLDQEIESVTLNAALDRGRLDLDFALDGGAAGQVDLDAVFADLRDPDSTVDGTLALEWRDLEGLSLLSPDVGSVAGNVRANAQFGGTLAEPKLEGRAELTDGTIEIPTWALTIDDIAATAVTVDGTLLEYSGVGLIAGDPVHLTGSTELDPARDWPTRLKITGEELEIVRRADAQIWASPDLDADVALPNIAVRGTVHIPHAVIMLEQLPAQAVRPSPDAIVRGAVQLTPPRPLHVRADVRVTLGDDIRYNAAGLQTEVEGELGLHYESGLTPTAQGSLRLDGTYNAYGQVLDLERGELLFTGPLDDPAVDVRAVREIGDTKVGVQLTGALKAPATRIYSEPAMSEADALSYLLLGRPLSGTGEAETATLESAAVAMGLQQALPAVQRIGTSLGLDELSIQTTDTDTGSVTAGKYLSSRLYVRYSYGLFTRIGGLLVRFSFNDRLSVEARSGDEDSVDLLYTVEKN